MRKLLVALALVALAAFIALAAFVHFRGEEALRTAIERHGPPAFGAPVEVSRVSLSPLTGSGRVEGLAIWNPEGFSEARAIEVERLQLDMRLRSLFTDVLHIEELHIAAPVVRVEPGRAGINIRALQGNLREALPPPEVEREVRVIVRDFRMQAPVIVVGSEEVGVSDRELVLDDIHLTDIGGEEGVAPEQAVRVVMDALLAEVERALATEAGRRLLEEGLSRLEELLRRR
jgi:uncharacterized protein involved in outer membrane biogenesis